jgi:hypothetical protein
MLDVVDGGRYLPLVIIDDPTGHVVRRHAAIRPDNGNHGNFDVGKNIGRRLDRRHRAEDQYEDREDNKRVRPAKGQANDCYHADFSVTYAGFVAVPVIRNPSRSRQRDCGPKQ